MDLPSLDECPEGDEHEWTETDPPRNEPMDSPTPAPTALYRCSNCGLEVTDVDPRDLDRE